MAYCGAVGMTSGMGSAGVTKETAVEDGMLDHGVVGADRTFSAMADASCPVLMSSLASAVFT